LQQNIPTINFQNNIEGEMHIYSKIVGSDKHIFEINTNEKLQDEASFYEQHSENVIDGYCSFKSQQFYGNGFCIIETTMHTQKKIIDYFAVHGGHVMLSFFFQGHSRIMDPQKQSDFILDEGLMRCHFQQNSLNQIEMSGKSNVRYVCIILSRDFFLNAIDGRNIFKDQLSSCVQNNIPYPLNKCGMAISPEMNRILSSLCGNTYSGKYKRYFTELKIKEILFLSYEQQARQNSSAMPSLYKEELIRKIEMAKGILSSNYAEPPTIKQLSRLVALNELKLKNSFREICGTTIYNYVIRFRMEIAAQLLKSNELTIGEISTRTGYSSPSHFITVYKKYFGDTPKQSMLKIALNIAGFLCIL